MKELLVTRLRLAVVTAKLCGPRWCTSGGRRESRAQAATHRSPSGSPAGGELDAERPVRLRIRIAFSQLRTHPKSRPRPPPSTLLAFHQALARGKYRWLFSSTSCPRKPGPTGPDDALIEAIVELNRYVRSA